MPKLKELSEKTAEYKQLLEKRGAENLLAEFEKGLKHFNEARKIHIELQNTRTEKNRLSKEYGKTKSEECLKKAETVKKKIEVLEKKLFELNEKISLTELMLPNWLEEDVPKGKEEDSKAIEYKGIPVVWEKHAKEFEKLYPKTEFKKSSEKPFHHFELVGKLVDQEKASEIAGARFYCELDELVLLDFALSLYAFEFFRKKGYSDKLMITPYLMRKSVEEKITYYTAFADTIFELEKEGLILIPSSEHSIVAYYMDQIFEEKHLPKRIMAWTPCFRKEAGAHGKDTKGMFRAKQFHKVELHSIMPKGNDLNEIEKIRKDTQEFMHSLELPNRSVVLASQDTDMRSLKQVDIETWMPGQGKFRETHSIASLGTWVSEKTKMRYRTKQHEKELTRNVYATAIATQRTICAIAENHFNAKKNTINIPKPLQKYCLGLTEIKL